MNPEHRKIIKENSNLLEKSVDYKKLINYLREYKSFNKRMWTDMNSISDVLELLPTRGPKAFCNFIEILKKAGYITEAELLEKQTLRFESSHKLFYSMSSIPLGYCLIINNMKFDHPKLEYRAGSNVDEKSLHEFFEKADFEVKVERDLTSRDMEKCLLNFSKRDFSKVDSMILIMMSHGEHINNREILYGRDGNPDKRPPEGFIYKDNIYNMFSNEECEDLQNKPKVFFFIACRGKGKDYGVRKRKPKESLDSIGDVILPERSDMLFINSSVPYSVTIRDHDRGTYFCQALIAILNENYKSHDLEDMIKLVNQKLDGKVSETYRIVQAVHVDCTALKKKIMFYRRN